MEIKLYTYSLCISLALMLFFGAYFLLANVPDKVVYRNYLLSRRIMGIAMLELSANYCVHLFVQPRFSASEWAICMNLSTYFLAAWLFSSALTQLLDKKYITVKRFVRHLIYWGVYTLVSAFVLSQLNSGYGRALWLIIIACVFFAYAYNLARRLLLTYKRAVSAMDYYSSDDVAIYIRWMSRFTYWAVVFGVAVGGLTFLPNKYIFMWILSAIPFYIYLFISYMNYQLFCEQVEHILSNEEAFEELDLKERHDGAPNEMENAPLYYDLLSQNIPVWIAGKGYTRAGLTLQELANEMGSNRTYLSSYIKKNYQCSFREWINMMRIRAAKEMMIQQPQITISEIAVSLGYANCSSFITIFSEFEKISPAKWRKQYLG